MPLAQSSLPDVLVDLEALSDLWPGYGAFGFCLVLRLTEVGLILSSKTKSCAGFCCLRSNRWSLTALAPSSAVQGRGVHN